MDGLYEQCIRPVRSLRPSGSIAPLPPCLLPHVAATCDGESESAGPAPQARYGAPTWLILVLSSVLHKFDFWDIFGGPEQ